jgi:hypothetical protein
MPPQNISLDKALWGAEWEFEEGKLVKARLQATHPLAKPVVSCLSRLWSDF